MSVIKQTDNRREAGGELNLTKKFNSSGTPALAVPGSEDAAIGAVNVKNKLTEVDTLGKMRRLDDDPNAMGGLRAIDSRDIKNFLIEAKKKKDDFVRLLVRMSLNEAVGKVRDYAAWLGDESIKWSNKQDQALNDLAEFDKARSGALKAYTENRLERDENGNFKDKDLQTHILLTMKCYDMDLDTLKTMTDADAARLVKRALNDEFRLRNDLTEQFTLSGKIKDIFKNAESKAGLEIEDIMNNPDWSDEVKKDELRKVLENTNRDILRELKNQSAISKLGNALLEEVVADVNKKNLDEGTKVTVSQAPGMSEF